MRLAEAQKRASSATAAGDHREALKCHLRALALAKVHVAAVTAAGGRLSRDEATAVARTHMAIAETYEASKGLGLAFSGAEAGRDGPETSGRDVLQRLDREASDMAGLTQAVTHLQHAIGACAVGAAADASVSGASRESCARALRATKLEARARLGPRLLAVGRAEDAAETTRRALEAMALEDEEAPETDAFEAELRGAEKSKWKTRLELLLGAADAERAVGERFAARARDLKRRARAAAASTAAAAADLDAAAESSAFLSASSAGRSGDEEYAEKARLARAAADEAEAGETARRDAEAEASRQFEASETRLDEAERLVAKVLASAGEPDDTRDEDARFAASLLTRRRSLRRARRDWRGAAACVLKLLALAEANGGALPGTNRAASGSATGALRSEAAELFVRAKAFDDAEAYAAAAAEALKDPVTKKHTAASVRASGALAFIAARRGDLAGAAQMYRDARSAALTEKAFGAATETSADLADLEAALGSVRFAMSEAAGDEDPAPPRDAGEDAPEEKEKSIEEMSSRERRAAEAAAEAAARDAARQRRLAAIAALEEALGCFARAADIERGLGGAYSARCAELETRADACAAALAEERAAGEDGAAFL